MLMVASDFKVNLGIMGSVDRLGILGAWVSLAGWLGIVLGWSRGIGDFKGEVDWSLGGKAGIRSS